MSKKRILFLFSVFLFICPLFSQDFFEEYEQDLSPVFEFIDIPPAGLSYAGQKIPVIIHGKNFFQTNEEGQEFSVTGIEYSDFSVKDDNTVYLFVVCPDKAGKTKIKIKFGTTEKTEFIKVYPDERCFTTGDIIFSDGTRLRPSELKYGITDAQREKAVAVIGSTPFGGAIGYGIGLYQEEGLPWAKENTRGCSESFPKIAFKDYKTNWDESYYIVKKTYPDEYDSSENWNYICSVDPEGTQNAAENYPLFSSALNYGEKHNLSEGYKDGWFIPDMHELNNIGSVRNKINQSLDICESELVKTRFYSSSNAFYENGVFFAYFSKGDRTEMSDHINTWGNAPRPTYRESTLSKSLVIKKFDSSDFSRFKSNEQPEITKIHIPVCNASMTGKKIPVYIYGNNLSGTWVKKNFQKDNRILYDYYRVSDHEIHAFVKCPEKENPVVSIIAGDKVKKVKVKFTEKKIRFHEGDLLLTNGMILRKDNLSYGIPDEYKDLIFAMVGKVNKTGTECTAMGLFPSSEKYSLFSKDAALYNSHIAIAKYNEEDKKEDLKTYVENRDGETVWAQMCRLDSEGTSNPMENYPAFYRAQQYGFENNLPEKFQNGWYLPSADEFSCFDFSSISFYENSDDCFAVPNSVISKSEVIYGYTVTPGFWSCSQEPYRKNHFYYFTQYGSLKMKPVYYYDDNIYFSSIDDKNRVPSVRKFSITDFREMAYPKPVFDPIAKRATGEYASDAPFEIEITGKHFTGPFVKEFLSLEGIGLSGWELLNDRKILLTVVTPNKAGEFKYTVSYKDIRTEGVLKVFEKKKCFTPGDILYTDGKKISFSNLKNGITDERKSNIYGIVASTSNGGEKALIMSYAAYKENNVEQYIEENNLSGSMAENWRNPAKEELDQILKNNSKQVLAETFSSLGLDFSFVDNLTGYNDSIWKKQEAKMFSVKELSLFRGK